MIPGTGEGRGREITERVVAGTQRKDVSPFNRGRVVSGRE